MTETLLAYAGLFVVGWLLGDLPVPWFLERCWDTVRDVVTLERWRRRRRRELHLTQRVMELEAEVRSLERENANWLEFNQKHREGMDPDVSEALDAIWAKRHPGPQDAPLEKYQPGGYTCI